ncbi:unnamed protein product [Heterobilharzia americana]|nr:unnamed protein product [Heterobilharzia americana]
MSKGNEKLNPCDIGKLLQYNTNNHIMIQDEIEVSSDISGKEIKHSNTLGTMESFVAQTYRAKFFGNISVSEPRGDFICERSLGLLKAQLLTSKLHKKRIRIRVDTSGISVLGSRNSTVHHIHNFENITFIWTDPCDLQSCGIIVRQTLLGENTYEFYGYKLYQNTPKLIGALKKIYSDLHLPPSSEEVPDSSENTKDTVPSEAKEENDSDLIQLVDISDNVNPSKEMKCPDIKSKEIGSKWTAFDDHFDKQESVLKNCVPVDSRSQNSNSLHFASFNQGFFSQTNASSQMFNSKNNSSSITEVFGPLPLGATSYFKSYSTTASFWPSPLSSIQTKNSICMPRLGLVKTCSNNWVYQKSRKQKR